MYSELSNSGLTYIVFVDFFLDVVHFDCTAIWDIFTQGQREQVRAGGVSRKSEPSIPKSQNWRAKKQPFSLCSNSEEDSKLFCLSSLSSRSRLSDIPWTTLTAFHAILYRGF
jgi:hypothetical protein